MRWHELARRVATAAPISFTPACQFALYLATSAR